MHRCKPDLRADADKRENEASLYPERVELGSVSHEVSNDKARVSPNALCRDAEGQDPNQKKYQAKRNEEEVFPDRLQRLFRSIKINQRHKTEGRQLKHYPEQTKVLRYDHKRACKEIRVQRRIVEPTGGLILRLIHSLQEARRIEYHCEKRVRQDQQKEASQWIDPKPRAGRKRIQPSEKQVKGCHQVPPSGCQRCKMILLQGGVPRRKRHREHRQSEYEQHC